MHCPKTANPGMGFAEREDKLILSVRQSLAALLVTELLPACLASSGAEWLLALLTIQHPSE